MVENVVEQNVDGRVRVAELAASASMSPSHFAALFRRKIELPGFGPYTSRAVASIAFGEHVWCFRRKRDSCFLSRRYGLPVEHWLPKGRLVLQTISDEIAALGEADLVNQGLMELGATICTPQKHYA